MKEIKMSRYQFKLFFREKVIENLQNLEHIKTEIDAYYYTEKEFQSLYGECPFKNLNGYKSSKHYYRHKYKKVAKLV